MSLSEEVSLSETIPLPDEAVRVEGVFDPLSCMTTLADSGLYEDYVVYERLGEWVFAGGTLGTIELDAETLRISWLGEVSTSEWSGRPSVILDEALSRLPILDRNIYGWIGFEFCAHALDAAGHLPRGVQLAHLMIPRVEVVVTEGGAVIRGADEARRTRIEALLSAASPRHECASTPVDIRSDTSKFRERVATAVAEIREGRYQKVILSRKIELPFALDFPATYARGRVHNTPARSFLLRLGGLAATGFCPELVASVDASGIVTAEPLAGTRAFGQGAERDLAAREELLSDPKEIVEHAVSVRTTLAEVASVTEPDTLAVSDFMSVRERGSVQHLASTVRGRLSGDHSRWGALEALFPSVTASGIPKAESVDAIFRLDAETRGLYSGAVVRITSRGALEAALVLRAAYHEDGRTWLRAGAGVIAQSTPEREFEETCEKLGSIAPYLVAREGYGRHDNQV